MTERTTPFSLRQFNADVPPGRLPIGWGHLTADRLEIETAGQSAAAARLERRLREEMRTTVPDVAITFKECNAALHRDIFLADSIEDDHYGMLAIAHEEKVTDEYEATLVDGPAAGHTVTARADSHRLVIPYAADPEMKITSTITELTYERQFGHPRRFVYTPGGRT